MNQKSTPQQWLHAVLITGSILLTPLASVAGGFNDGNLGGRESSEFFLPAAYAFSIWSVIYLGLFALGIWQGLPAQADNIRARQGAPWLSASAISNLVWLVLAGSLATLAYTIPTIVFMGVTAWIAYLKFDLRPASRSTAERVLSVPLQIYVGWLSVATVANMSGTLNALGWGGWGISPESWGIIMLVVATAVAWEVGRRVNHDNVYRGVFVWAFIAIFVKQQPTPAVAYTALAGALVISLMIFATLPPVRARLFSTAQ